MQSCQCVLDPEYLERLEIAATSANQERREAAGATFFATLTPEQKHLYLHVEEIMVEDMVAVRAGVVREIHCSECSNHGKTGCWL